MTTTRTDQVLRIDWRSEWTKYVGPRFRAYAPRPFEMVSLDPGPHPYTEMTSKDIVEYGHERVVFNGRVNDVYIRKEHLDPFMDIIRSETELLAKRCDQLERFVKQVYAAETLGEFRELRKMAWILSYESTI